MHFEYVPGLLVFTLALAGCHATIVPERAEVREPRVGTVEADCGDGRFVEELGPPPSVRGNGQRIHLGCGVYRGDLLVRGNDVIVEGSGPGRSVVIGSLVVRGNDNAVRGVTFTRPSAVRGNANEVDANEFAGGVRLRGNDVAP